MPRITLLKITLSPIVALILLAVLWFTLPFPPTVNQPFSGAYIENALRSGSRITTVQSPGSSFVDQESAINVQRPDGNFNSGVFEAVAISWQLQHDSRSNVVFLEIGNSVNPEFGALIDLTDLAGQSPRFVKYTIVDFWTPAGDRDGVSISSFDYADAVMFYHQAGNTWQAVRLRFLIPQTGMVQVWKDMRNWDSLTADDIPMIDDEDRDQGLIATFDLSKISAQPMVSLEDVNVPYLSGRLTTRTYPIRRLILTILKFVSASIIAAIEFSEPMFSAVGELLRYTFIVLSAYFITSLACWTMWGRGRPFLKWARDFWLTRDVHRIIFGPPPPTIWTVSGPMHYEHDGKGYGGATEERIKPLTGVVSFFTSASPLDSLLASFESTKWMVKPPSGE